MPFQAGLAHLQRLVQTRSLKDPFGEVEAAIPATMRRPIVPIATQHCAGATGQYPTVIQRMAKYGRASKNVFNSFHLAIDDHGIRVFFEIMRERNIDAALV